MSIVSKNAPPDLKRQAETQQRRVKETHPVDARFMRLKADVLPAAPYILSTQKSLRPDHLKLYYPQNSISWRKYSPFREGEDDLQYVTFKDRSGDADIFGMSTNSGWDDGKGRIARPADAPNRTSSDSTPRQGQAPLKKISLADYKNREKNRATPAGTNALPSDPKGDSRNDKNNAEVATAKVVLKPQQTEPHGQKRLATSVMGSAEQNQLTRLRSADVMTGATNPQSLANPSHSPPNKKARSTSESKITNKDSTAKASTANFENAAVSGDMRPDSRKASVQVGDGPKSTIPTKSDQSQTHSQDPPVKDVAKSRLPPMLSPLNSKKATKSRIPPMLSPLSSSIEDELARMAAATPVKTPKAKNAKSLHDSPLPKSVERARTSSIPNGKSDSAVTEKSIVAKDSKNVASSKQPQETKVTVSTPRSVSKEISSKGMITPMSSSKAMPNGHDVAAATPKSTPPDAQKRMRLRVILKIKKKANRKQLAQYLNMKPTPGRNALFPSHSVVQKQRPVATVSEAKNSINTSGSSMQSNVKKESKSSHLEGAKAGEKRSRAHLPPDEEELESEPSAKRKTPARPPHSQKIHTPKIPPASSPALSHLGSSHKRPTSAPSTENNGKAMSRVPSSQGTVNTPQQPVANGTPSAPDSHTRRRSDETPGKPRSDDMRKEGNEYASKAVKLKHDADIYLKKKENMSEDDRKRGLAIGTESVLCFMLAFTCLDSVRAYSDKGVWESILPYLISNLQGEARHYKHLAGFLLQIEAVIRDNLTHAYMRSLDKDPVERDLGNHPMDVSESNEAKIQRRAAEYHRQFSAMHSHAMKAQTAWRDGWSLLNVPELSKTYPRSWSKRDVTKQARGKDREMIKRGEYTRSYNLPMNNMTSSMEAINFGLAFLAEWSEEMKVDWKPKLVL